LAGSLGRSYSPDARPEHGRSAAQPQDAGEILWMDEAPRRPPI